MFKESIAETEKALAISPGKLSNAFESRIRFTRLRAES